MTALSPLASNFTFSEMDIAPILHAMTTEGIISTTQIDHFDNIDQFEHEVNPLPSKPPIVPFQEMVNAKMERLKLEMPIYDSALEAKLASQVKTLMQQLSTIYLKLHQTEQ